MAQYCYSANNVGPILLFERSDIIISIDPILLLKSPNIAVSMAQFWDLNGPIYWHRTASFGDENDVRYSRLTIIAFFMAKYSCFNRPNIAVLTVNYDCFGDQYGLMFFKLFYILGLRNKIDRYPGIPKFNCFFLLMGN